MHIKKEELEIIERFKNNVFGRKPNTSSKNTGHDGKSGHWLEEQMGVQANRRTEADLLGFEMKDGTASKISFGDWSADYYIFKDEIYSDKNKSMLERRNESFLYVFGKPNPDKLGGSRSEGRYSWSGEPIPKINKINDYGQELVVDDENNILIKYYFSKDLRPDKLSIVPIKMQSDNLIIVKWFANGLKKKVDDKFNRNGWFVCKKDSNGYYNAIAFGEPISFDVWIGMVRSGEIFFDSGMYETNNRPYSQWRANNSSLENLFIRIYPPFPN